MEAIIIVPHHHTLPFQEFLSSGYHLLSIEIYGRHHNDNSHQWLSLEAKLIYIYLCTQTVSSALWHAKQDFSNLIRFFISRHQLNRPFKRPDLCYFLKGQQKKLVVRFWMKMHLEVSVSVENKTPTSVNFLFWVSQVESDIFSDNK